MKKEAETGKNTPLDVAWLGLETTKIVMVKWIDSAVYASKDQLFPDEIGGPLENVTVGHLVKIENDHAALALTQVPRAEGSPEYRGIVVIPKIAVTQIRVLA